MGLFWKRNERYANRLGGGGGSEEIGFSTYRLRTVATNEFFVTETLETSNERDTIGENYHASRVSRWTKIVRKGYRIVAWRHAVAVQYVDYGIKINVYRPCIAWIPVVFLGRWATAKASRPIPVPSGRIRSLWTDTSSAKFIISIHVKRALVARTDHSIQTNTHFKRVFEFRYP